MAEPGNLIKTQIAQQEVSLVANVDWNDIFKSVARRNTHAKKEKEKTKRHTDPKGGSANMVDTQDEP